MCYGHVVCLNALSHLSLSESHRLLIQTLNVSCGLHVQTLRFGCILLNAMSAEL
jgi:hypothetical protein